MSTNDEGQLYWQRRNRDAIQAGPVAVPSPIINGVPVASIAEEVIPRTGDRGRAVTRSQNGGDASDELIVVDDNIQSSACIDLTDDTVIDLTSAPTNLDSSVLIHEAQPPRPAMHRTYRRKIPARAVLPVDSDEDVEVIATSQSAHGRLEGGPRSARSRSIATADSLKSVPPPPADPVSSQSSTNTAVICPICLDDASQIRSEGRQLSSTVCGHVFCDPCIRNAAKTLRMCPTCRRKLTVKSIHPLYL